MKLRNQIILKNKVNQLYFKKKSILSIYDFK